MTALYFIMFLVAVAAVAAVYNAFSAEKSRKENEKLRDGLGLLITKPTFQCENGHTSDRPGHCPDCGKELRILACSEGHPIRSADIFCTECGEPLTDVFRCEKGHVGMDWDAENPCPICGATVKKLSPPKKERPAAKEITPPSSVKKGEEKK